MTENEKKRIASLRAEAQKEMDAHPAVKYLMENTRIKEEALKDFDETELASILFGMTDVQACTYMTRIMADPKTYATTWPSLDNESGCVKLVAEMIRQLAWHRLVALVEGKGE